MVAERAEWERDAPLPPAIRRCLTCRRPHGFHLAAWRDGRYAAEVVLPGGGFYLACFRSNGFPITTKGEIDKMLENPDSRAMVVELNEAGYCPRCEVLRKQGMGHERYVRARR